MQQLNRQELRQKLVSCSLKATHQRIVVYEALLGLHGHHPAAEEVYRLLKPANPSISLGTVYKILDVFAENGLVRRVFSEQGCKRYDANTMAHSHIYCSNTREIIDFEDPELEELLQGFFQRRNMQNFEMHSFAIQLTGNKKEPDQQVSITKL
ncbi:transcriptional repressor [Pontibacter qinzhouensis]|uniref:Transcriptional repressor n=1 Tax=Pontibacter qinzhouensis TaxID=2603253 RepID=A0A5C8K9E9_9BACT|nr:transcriptional repressor [Pontibacter qinzhouensis]TXK48035.1 transcriptional repressor [Pontibacter qinzhouensis]